MVAIAANVVAWIVVATTQQAGRGDYQGDTGQAFHDAFLVEYGPNATPDEVNGR
jgi:hypothetical protein